MWRLMDARLRPQLAKHTRNHCAKPEAPRQSFSVFAVHNHFWARGAHDVLVHCGCIVERVVAAPPPALCQTLLWHARSRFKRSQPGYELRSRRPYPLAIHMSKV